MENLTLLTTEQLEQASYRGTLKALKVVAAKTPYIDDQKFCQMLGGVHRNTTAKIRQRGDISYRKVNNKILYTEADAIAYIEQFKIG